MEHNDLKKVIEEIKLSDQAKKRIIENCSKKFSSREKFSMNKTNKSFKRVLPLVAAAVLCMITSSAVVINHIRGYRDVVKNGAVIDTAFDEETEMIEINLEITDKIIVHANMLDYANLPYCELAEIESLFYHIVNSEGEIMTKGTAASISAFENGEVTFAIPMDEASPGEYTLVIDGFVGTKKADRPLHINGMWISDFVK